MLTLTDLILAAALFAGAVCVVAAACVVRAWQWERRYERLDECSQKIIDASKESFEPWNTELSGEDDIEMRRRWDGAAGGQDK